MPDTRQGPYPPSPTIHCLSDEQAPLRTHGQRGLCAGLKIIGAGSRVLSRSHVLCICLLAFFCCSLPHEADARVQARSAILYNATTGRILYSQNPNKRIPPASLTKIMSLYIAMDQIKSGSVRSQARVTISNYAATTRGSSMGLKRNERVPLMDLLEGMAVASGNDAAAAVAEYCGKGVPAFVRRMNAKAKQLGMKQTVYKTPHGLPAEGQYTTATDVLQLTKYYLQNHSKWLFLHKTTAIRHKSQVLYNTNSLLATVPGADGLKTGFTVASGYNIVLTAKRGKTRLVAILLGARSRQTRDAEARQLLEAGFASPTNAKSIAKKLR